jgi:hypothetical protein
MSAVPLDVQRRLEQRWAARLLRRNEPSEAKYRRPEARTQDAAAAKAKRKGRAKAASTPAASARAEAPRPPVKRTSR